MKRSDHRILTTHAGRLDGPPELIKLSRDVMAGRVADVNALRPAVQRGIVDVIGRQAGAGVDVISDGEVGKFGFGSLTYYGRRLSGLTTRPLQPMSASSSRNSTGTFNFCRRRRNAPYAAVR